MLTFKQFCDLNEAAKAKTTTSTLPMLVFKRRAVRVFPDGKEVAAYYSSEINKTLIYPNTFSGS